MKQFIGRVLFCSILLAGSIALAVPPMKVTVFDAAGKVAFQATTDTSGTFVTGALQPGRYVVQFNSKNAAAVKGDHYGLFISAGSKKVLAESVAGDKFVGGGVAMRIAVDSGLKIAGQVTPGLIVRIDPKTGKRLVWLRPRTGSNLPGRWIAEDSAELVTPQNTISVRTDEVRKWQDHGDGHL